MDAYAPVDRVSYNGRGARPLQAVARLKAGVGVGRAQAELRAIGARLAQAYPEDNVLGGADLERLDEGWKNSRRRPLALLSIAAFLVLAIVCTNVVNLVVSRALARRREMSIRMALGARLSTIVRQLLAESLVLCGGALILGVLIARWALQGLPVVLRFAGASPPAATLAMDGTALTFAAVLCLSVTIVCGLAPVLFIRSLTLNTSIKDGGESGLRRDSSAFRLRRCLVVGQVAVSLILLLSAGAFLRVFVKLMNRNPGFQSSQVYHFGIGLPDARYTDAQSAEFHYKLREKLRQIPGVEAAGATYRLPLNGRTHTTSFQFEGGGLPKSQWSWVAYNVIDPAYFTVLRIPLLAGRSFSWETDRPGRPMTVVVNRTFQRLYGKDGRVLGKRLQLRFSTDLVPKSVLWEVVGVVADTYQTGRDKDIRPQVYLAISQTGLDGGSYVIRSARTDPGLAASFAAAVRDVDPDLERISVKQLDRWVSASLGDRRMPALLTSLFATLGLLLTALGIYGTVTLEMGARRREIAIRRALGADHARITGLVLRHGLGLTGIGTAIGLLVFIPAGRVLEAQLYETAPADPMNAVAVVAILFACAIAACLRPAWEALRLNPLSGLREI